MGTYRAISKETKEQILNRIRNEGISVPQAAKDAGISDSAIYNWLGRTAQAQGTTEVIRLRRELQATYELIGKLTAELNVFKKKDGYRKRIYGNNRG